MMRLHEIARGGHRQSLICLFVFESAQSLSANFPICQSFLSDFGSEFTAKQAKMLKIK
jgi:hypothetical protein